MFNKNIGSPLKDSDGKISIILKNSRIEYVEILLAIKIDDDMTQVK